MAHTWFLYTNDHVTGPLSTQELQEKVSASELSENSFVWWKGQREWIPLATWRKEFTSILASRNANLEKPIWYIDLGESPIGPLTQNELVENLNALRRPHGVRIWAVGMKKWKSLFEVYDIMERMGISRREHERAPLMGSAIINRTNDAPIAFTAKISSISVGGIGLSNTFDLRRGDDVSLTIKTRDIPNVLHLDGEVIYTTKSGSVGIKFKRVPAESATLIHDYVKKFLQEHQDSKKSAA